MWSRSSSRPTYDICPGTRYETLHGRSVKFPPPKLTGTVQALEETDTLCLHREDLLAVVRNRFEVVEKILEVIACRICNTDTLLAEAHFLDITSRLAKKILDLGDAFGIREEGRVRIGAGITQKDLASMVGATAESPQIPETLSSRWAGHLDVAPRDFLPTAVPPCAAPGQYGPCRTDICRGGFPRRTRR